MIAIINYGLGNVLAFANIYKKAGIPAKLVSSPADLAGVTKLILPGVGAFDHAITQFESSGLRAPVEVLVLEKQVPVLGICVGMQMLARASDEGVRSGLSWVPGTVRKIDVSSLTQRTRLPHMGWNTLEPRAGEPLFDGLGDKPEFYFLHSFYYSCDERMHSIGATEYGIRFSSALRRDNIYGVQFHPEKSHAAGTRLLTNFALKA